MLLGQLLDRQEQALTERSDGIGVGRIETLVTGNRLTELFQVVCGAPLTASPGRAAVSHG